MTTRLNVGPGDKWRRADWKTIDHYVTAADFQLDLRECPRWPIPSRSIEKIFCSHVIEHLTDEAVLHLFREAERVLHTGGILRVSCPDLQKAVQQYRAGDCDPDREVVTKGRKDAPNHERLLNVAASFRGSPYHGITNTKDGSYSGGPIVSQAEVDERLQSASLDEFSRWCVSLIPEEASYRAHINGHWPDKVERLLRAAGFQDISISDFGASSDPELREPDFDNRPKISLFVEARATPSFLGRVESLRWRAVQQGHFAVRAAVRRARKLKQSR